VGYMLCFGNCICCKRVFGFNPNKVPSVRIPLGTGPREPICRDCVNAANPRRVRNELAPIPVHEDAYEPESEDDMREFEG
jgi:hypothetical protein